MRPLLLTLLVSSHLSYADTATDTQTLSLTVPLVALIDVQDISPIFEFKAPTEAGKGFTSMKAPINNKPLIAISSNNSFANLKIRTDTDLSTANIALQIDADGLCGDTITLNTNNETLCHIGMYKTADTAGVPITIRAISSTVGGMIPYGIHTTNIIYTLTQD
jgi:hypothetical protein